MNKELFEAVCRGRKNDAERLVNEMLAENVNVEEILMESMVPAMRDIGEKFARNEVYVPEMLIAARAMQAGLDILDPLLTQSGHEPLATVAIATVKGDLHDIGKNLVAMMLKGAGFAVVDLGVDCGVEKFQDAVDNQGVTVVMLSALLTTTMSYMKVVADHFASNENVKVFIGGAPITQQYSDEIGADGYSEDAHSAVLLVEDKLGFSKSA
jgi:5-methyltetrahydrofolate--homocysteine methyltransferase